KPNAVLNTIVADALSALVDQIEKLKAQKGLDAAINEVVMETLRKHQRVLFHGNGYSAEWHAEAAARGLPNFKNAVDAIGNFCAEKNVAMFERFGVLTAKEAESRMNIQFESYCKAISIEGQSSLSIARTMVLPAAQAHQGAVAASIAAAKAIGLDVSGQQKRLSTMSALIEQLIARIDDLGAQFEFAESHPGTPGEHAKVYRDKVATSVQRVRETADALETMVDDALWPLPKYREMLFVQ
ncbi:MAG: glutamine synthetase type III, partial [Planctomycetota bacterium]